MCCDISAQEEVDISRLKLPPTLGKKISRSRSRSRGKRRSSRSRSPRGAGAAGSRRQRSRSRSRGRRRSRSRSRDRDSKDRHRYAYSSSGRACCLLGCANDALTAIMLVLHRSSRDRSSDRGRGGRPHRSSRSRSPAVRSTKDKDDILREILAKERQKAEAHGRDFARKPTSLKQALTLNMAVGTSRKRSR